KTSGYEPFISAQNEYNLMQTKVEEDLVPALQQYGLGLLPYFPLASGLLTGKYRRGEEPPAGSRIATWNMQAQRTDKTFDKVEKLEKYASERGIGLLDVAIGGLAARPTVASVIAGATSAEQVRANVAAGNWKPDEADQAALREITG